MSATSSLHALHRSACAQSSKIARTEQSPTGLSFEANFGESTLHEFLEQGTSASLYPSATSTSGSPPSVAETRIFGVLSLCTVDSRDLSSDKRSSEDERGDHPCSNGRRRRARDDDVEPDEGEDGRVSQ